VEEAVTPEQKAANERLTEAIQEARQAYGYEDGYLVTDWVVLTAETRYDEDGDQICAYGRLHQDGAMADHRVLGLLEVHREYVRSGLFPSDE
jgi:hypothetical protein